MIRTCIIIQEHASNHRHLLLELRMGHVRILIGASVRRGLYILHLRINSTVTVNDILGDRPSDAPSVSCSSLTVTVSFPDLEHGC